MPKLILEAAFAEDPSVSKNMQKFMDSWAQVSAHCYWRSCAYNIQHTTYDMQKCTVATTPNRSEELLSYSASSG